MRIGCYAFLICLSPMLQAKAAIFEVTLLPSPPGATTSVASGVSEAGTVGQVSVEGDLYSVRPVWWQGGQAVPLPVPTGFQGAASEVNALGEIIGDIKPSGAADPQPVVWRNGSLQSLDTLGMPAGQAFGINDAGVIVGQLYDVQAACSKAVIWSAGQTQLLPGFTAALAINNRGDILVAAGGSYAVWSGGSAVPLTSPTASLAGRAINDSGHVAGSIPREDGSFDEVFLWKQGAAERLPALADDSFSLARAINGRDQIVGHGYNAAGGIHAVLWEDGNVFDLQSLIPASSGWILYEAMDIDESGRIVGYGSLNGQIQAFLLTPSVDSFAAVPEPASLALVGFAFVPSLMRRVRRKGR